MYDVECWSLLFVLDWVLRHRVAIVTILLYLLINSSIDVMLYYLCPTVWCQVKNSTQMSIHISNDLCVFLVYSAICFILVTVFMPHYLATGEEEEAGMKLLSSWPLNSVLSMLSRTCTLLVVFNLGHMTGTRTWEDVMHTYGHFWLTLTYLTFAEGKHDNSNLPTFNMCWL